MYKILYLPTAQFVCLKSHVKYTKEILSSFITGSQHVFVPNSDYSIIYCVACSTDMYGKTAQIPKHLFEVVEVPDV